MCMHLQQYIHGWDENKKKQRSKKTQYVDGMKKKKKQEMSKFYAPTKARMTSQFRSFAIKIFHDRTFAFPASRWAPRYRHPWCTRSALGCRHWHPWRAFLAWTQRTPEGPSWKTARDPPLPPQEQKITIQYDDIYQVYRKTVKIGQSRKHTTIIRLVKTHKKKNVKGPICLKRPHVSPPPLPQK